MDLSQRLEALPQELYDEILEFTFTASNGHRKFQASQGPANPQDARCSATFPHLLHVSRSTRAMFAKSYYGDPAGLIVYDRYSSLAGVIGLTRWLCFLQKEHREMIQRIKVILGEKCNASRLPGEGNLEALAQLAAWERSDWIADLDAHFCGYRRTLKAELRDKITVEVQE